MTREEAIKELEQIDDDREQAHKDADAILLAFLEDNGFGDVRRAYLRVVDRLGGFWYA